MPDHIVEWTSKALAESHKDERELHNAKISALESNYRTLQNKIDKSYEDKLEGQIDQEFWAAQNSRWRLQQADVETQLAALRATNTSYMEQGMKLMELANKASSLFGHMSNEEKHEMMSLVLSNPRIENGSLRYDFKKPFSLFTNVVDVEDWRGGSPSRKSSFFPLLRLFQVASSSKFFLLAP